MTRESIDYQKCWLLFVQIKYILSFSTYGIIIWSKSFIDSCVLLKYFMLALSKKDGGKFPNGKLLRVFPLHMSCIGRNIWIGDAKSSSNWFFKSTTGSREMFWSFFLTRLLFKTRAYLRGVWSKFIMKDDGIFVPPPDKWFGAETAARLPAQLNQGFLVCLLCTCVWQISSYEKDSESIYIKLNRYILNTRLYFSRSVLVQQRWQQKSLHLIFRRVNLEWDHDHVTW